MVMHWFATLILLAFPVVVVDPSGAGIPAASVTISTPSGTSIWTGTAGSDGMVELPDLQRGTYIVRIRAAGFEPAQRSVTWPLSESETADLRLEIGRISSDVTVTAVRGTAENMANAQQSVSIITEEQIAGAPAATIGNALTNSPGVLIQQSTSAQVSPFLRGLTGYQVLNLVDGVRFNNSTFRFGPNQYLALLEPSQARAVEVVMGPSSSLYGSDSMGGTIHVITPSPEVGGTSGLSWRGRVSTFASSGDASGGGNAEISAGNLRHALLISGTHRRHNAIRAGNGLDSHNVFMRYFGLEPSDIPSILDSRQTETNFTQSGGAAKWVSRFGDNQNLTAWYQTSRQSDVHGYKDLLGGRGQLRADFDPQNAHLFYTRLEQRNLGVVESLAGTFSVNAQTDGFVRQGLSHLDTITDDSTRVLSLGFAAQATSRLGSNHSLVFGGERYGDYIKSTRDEFSPRTGLAAVRRPLYPDGSRYNTFGAFVQSASNLVGNRLRLVAGGRWTRVGFRTFQDSFGVIDSRQLFHDATFNAALTWNLNSAVSVNFLAGRGFRAPNLNDLGAIGINDLGFEIPSSEAAQVGSLMGDSSGEGAVPTGMRVTTLKSERLFNFELGTRIDIKRLHARINVFDSEYLDPISRRTLLFPVDSVPQTISGLAVSTIPQTAAQGSQGVVTVATSLDPRALKSFVNIGRQRFYGVDHNMRVRLADSWTAEASYAFLVGRELNPNRNLRRLPPQLGSFRLRHARSRWWSEAGVTFAGPQERLNGGDVGDERIGADRNRRDILSFFNGSRVQSYVSNGIFLPTQETVQQIQNRVLPIGAQINGITIVDDNTRVPLFTKTPGYATFNFLGGVRVSENVQLSFALMNLLDRNYRVHGSGIDAPGIDAFVRWTFLF